MCVCGLLQSAHRDKRGPGRMAGRAGCAVLLVLAPDSSGVSSRAASVFIPLRSCFLPPDSGDHQMEVENANEGSGRETEIG